MDGFLLVEKGQGVTSFHVVAQIRRVLRVHKVGHGGTLDPHATGLLPILVGEGTKLTPFLVDLDKEYEATVLLGVRTDTFDITGQVLEERAVPPLTVEALRNALGRFVGEISQVPPMFSALHHAGQRLHELARRGITVERPPRTVHVHSIELLDFTLPRVHLRVACGKGTYVRALCADLGEAIGCGATVERVVRTRLGSFTLAEAVPWSELVALRDPQPLRDRLLPLEVALRHLSLVILGERALASFRHGQIVPHDGVRSGQLYRVSGNGRFVGVGVGSAHGLLRPLRLFHAVPERPHGHHTERA